MAAGGPSGVITVWNLEQNKLQTVIKDAHDGPLRRLVFFAGEPVLMSAGADNALKQHIFDNEDGSARLLRYRSGHAAPPHCLQFYGQEGRVLLSAAGDQAVRVFSVIQDQQSLELSQVRLHYMILL
jgi:U3 small nucleolar RNA-associated protein 21